MRDNHNLYLKTDVLLLAKFLRIFETYARKITSLALVGITLLLDWLGMLV